MSGPTQAVAALRAATADAHARLEAVMDLDREGLTLSRYGACLQVLLAARCGWEPVLVRHMPQAAGPHRDWLRADLAALGLAALPPVPVPVPELDAAEAWGMRYVLEGSALGGRVLLRRVAGLGLDAARGARYFAGWGAETGPRWTRFLRELEEAGTPDRLDGMCRGAVGAFAALTRAASARFDEALDARQDFAAPLAPVEDAVVADAGLQVLGTPVRGDRRA